MIILTIRSPASPNVDPVGQQSQRYDGLAESHVVRQASAESELPQERKPAQRVFSVPMKNYTWSIGTEMNTNWPWRGMP